MGGIIIFSTLGAVMARGMAGVIASFNDLGHGQSIKHKIYICHVSFFLLASSLGTRLENMDMDYTMIGINTNE